jgi:hypothetical protein
MWRRLVSTLVSVAIVMRQAKLLPVSMFMVCTIHISPLSEHVTASDPAGRIYLR